MASFVFSPPWFYGADIAIDVISFITLALVAIVSYRFFRFDRGHKLPLYLSLAFGVMAAAFLAKIGTYSLIYFYKNLNIQHIGMVKQVLSTEVAGNRPSYWGFSIGIVAYYFLYLTGLYMLYCIYQERLIRSDALITLLGFFLITYFSHNNYFAFHIMALLLLLLISSTYYYAFQRNKKDTTLILMSGFMLLAVSQAFFIFKTWSSYIYIGAQGIQLIGHLGLLTAMILVFHHGKKKK